MYKYTWREYEALTAGDMSWSAIYVYIGLYVEI